MNPIEHGSILEAALAGGYTFAAYRLPQGKLQVVVQRRTALYHFDVKAQEPLPDGFVIAPFAWSNPMLPYIRQDLDLSDPDGSLKALSEFETNGPEPKVDRLIGGREDHKRMLDRALDALGSGKLHKVVLARRIEEPLRIGLVIDLFRAFLERFPAACVCLARTPEYGLWCGVSPERMIQLKEGQIAVDSIAGTMPVEEAPAEARAWGSKEREEQQFVTEHVQQVLRALGTVRTEGPHVLRAGPVAHLQSTCTAEGDARLTAQVLLDLHPTPAVCGTPVLEARRFIEAHEKLDRGLYAGFWGPWLGDHAVDLYVNIRCAKLFHDHAELYVGGGITSASQPELEWIETERKAETWRTVIASLSASRIS